VSIYRDTTGERDVARYMFKHDKTTVADATELGSKLVRIGGTDDLGFVIESSLSGAGAAQQVNLLITAHHSGFSATASALAL
jgi:hypothetical protein